jgi:hypothetical protein
LAHCACITTALGMHGHIPLFRDITEESEMLFSNAELLWPNRFIERRPPLV